MASRTTMACPESEGRKNFAGLPLNLDRVTSKQKTARTGPMVPRRGEEGVASQIEILAEVGLDRGVAEETLGCRQGLGQGKAEGVAGARSVVRAETGRLADKREREGEDIAVPEIAIAGRIATLQGEAVGVEEILLVAVESKVALQTVIAAERGVGGQVDAGDLPGGDGVLVGQASVEKRVDIGVGRVIEGRKLIEGSHEHETPFLVEIGD